MRSDLFFIPHEIWGLPVFGVGWAVVLLVLGFLGWAGFVYSRLTNTVADPLQERPKWSEEVVSALPVFLIAIGLCVFVFPNVEARWPDGSPIGMPIRGYGIMVLSGLLLGIGITALRGRQLGVSADTIVSLGFWMMVPGLIGARAFFVIQKWSEFESVTDIFKLTEGGLVIYGGVIGGLVGAVMFCWRHQLKLLAVADLVAPGFLVGQSIGRIGCLLHGCCFGGVCTAELPAIYFPHGSIPYQAQIGNGKLLGLNLESGVPARIASVDEGSVAEKAGLEAGQIVESIYAFELPPVTGEVDPTSPPQILVELQVEGRLMKFPPAQLPAVSRATHPSQIYSTINALLLCLLIWFLQPLPKQDGITFCWAVLLYTSARFLLEGIRSDEAAQLGTGLSISQLFSILAIVACAAGLIFLHRLPPKRAWNWGGAN